MSTPLQLDHYQLGELIGSGGMGRVWEATRIRDRRPVAVKVLSLPAYRDRLARAALDGELRALAQLRHRNIGRLLDHGELDATTAEAIGAAPGSPYLVLERLEQSLSKQRFPWGVAQRILRNLLSALAHAHARGILHRDVKPANLMVPPRSPVWDVRLVDFGVANAVIREQVQGRVVSGTPAFMAPEQASGQWRDEGPWTDLFAVGKVATALLATEDHVAQVPEGFDQWLAGMVARPTHARFQHAADALWALDQLDGMPMMPVTLQLLQQSHSSHTVSLTELESLPETATQLQDFDFAEDFATAEINAQAPAPPPVHLPTDWSPPEEEVLVDPCEPRLLAIRRPRLQDRDPERTALWRALRTAQAEDRPRLILLEGHTGVGKSALARWFVEYCEEFGYAETLTTTCMPHDGFGTALSRTLLGRMNCLGLSADALGARLDRVLDRWTAPRHVRDAVAGIVAHRGQQTTDRSGAWRICMSWLSRHRPLVWWIDDAQWGEESLRMVQSLLNDDQGPVLVLLTLGLGTEEASTRQALDKLREQGERVELGPLPWEDHCQLVRELLPLDPTIADQLAEATAQRPALAVETVGTWLAEQALTWTPQGWQPSAQARAIPPDQAIQHRLDALIAPFGHPGRVAVAALGAWGSQVPLEPWQQVCATLGVPSDFALIEALVHDDLGHLDSDGFTFAHGAIRFAARALESSPEIHAAIAEALEGQPYSIGLAGEHWLLAGQPERAVQPLSDGVIEALGLHARAEARRLQARLEEAIRAAGISEEDPLQGHAWHQRIRIHISQAEYPMALDQAAQLVARAEQQDPGAWGEVTADARWLYGRLLHFHGRFDEAREQLDQALAWGQAHDHKLMQARAWFDHAQADFQQGANRAAQPKLERALELYTAADYEQGIFLGHQYLAYLFHEFGELEAMFEHAQAAYDIGIRRRNATEQAESLIMMASYYREHHQYKEAVKAFREAERLAGTSRTGVLARINLGLAFLDIGDYLRAEETLQGTFGPLERLGRVRLQLAAHIGYLVVEAYYGRAEAFDERMTQVTALLEERQQVSSDYVRSLRSAAKLASEHGWEERSAAASRIAEQIAGQMDYKP